ncbi:mammalian cell entry protein [Mycolicibacterium sp. 120266]|uniref:mammalian cell entry protein n=1 Tax=Mycolicibacterium sp. 120266 TaxID=3090601 RepID=UPI00299D68B8|nr:mammalian cell entry protein [Mycolicibacterium sp. 120266]MDX1875063.1 mammalian cell entry protein [Mycolicibacterium sp. 120266]
MAIDADAAGPEVRNPARIALLVGLTAVVGLVGVAGWLGFRASAIHREDQRQAAYLEVARQGAVNLTTIDHREVEADVKRILDSATGPFYDDFSSRAQPFIDVVKKAQSTSVGTVVSAGIESETDHDAQVLVAVSVKTAIADGSDQQPRSWRMRIAVQRQGDQLKVSNVSFVP